MIISMVQDIEQYLLKVCNPLQDQTVLKNILTGEVVTNVKVDKLIWCGWEAYTRFLNDRLKKKSLSIYSTINKIKFVASKAILNHASKLDIKSETIKALMFIEYASHRGYTIDELLQHEITNSAFFLMYENGYLRKNVKSQLGTELLKMCPLIDKKGPETPPQTHAIVIDFMALVRKVPLKSFILLSRHSITLLLP